VPTGAPDAPGDSTPDILAGALLVPGEAMAHMEWVTERLVYSLLVASSASPSSSGALTSAGTVTLNGGSAQYSPSPQGSLVFEDSTGTSLQFQGISAQLMDLASVNDALGDDHALAFSVTEDGGTALQMSSERQGENSARKVAGTLRGGSSPVSVDVSESSVESWSAPSPPLIYQATTQRTGSVSWTAASSSNQETYTYAFNEPSAAGSSAQLKSELTSAVSLDGGEALTATFQLSRDFTNQVETTLSAQGSVTSSGAQVGAISSACGATDAGDLCTVTLSMGTDQSTVLSESVTP
jgi:hypothetical protein